MEILTGLTLNQLISMTASGFYCEAGDFYIDPWQPVPRAVVTHAHGDHTRRGCGAYLVSAEGETVFRVRLGDDAPIQIIPMPKMSQPGQAIGRNDSMSEPERTTRSMPRSSTPSGTSSPKSAAMS